MYCCNNNTDVLFTKNLRTSITTHPPRPPNTHTLLTTTLTVVHGSYTQVLPRTNKIVFMHHGNQSTLVKSLWSLRAQPISERNQISEIVQTVEGRERLSKGNQAAFLFG